MDRYEPKNREQIEFLERSNKLFEDLDKIAVTNFGLSFFESIVRLLAEFIPANSIYFGQIRNKKLSTLATMIQGEISSNYQYAIKKELLVEILEKEELLIEENISESFRDDKLLQDAIAKSGYGIALKENNKNIGVIIILSNQKLNITDEIKSIVNRVALKVSAEIKRREIVRKLAASERKLKQSNTLKNKLFSIISHDLKNSFNNITLISDSMMLDYKSNDFHDFPNQIEMMSKSAIQASELLENILEWSVEQLKGKEFKQENIDLLDVFTATLSKLNHLAEQKGISVKADIELSTKLFADRNMLETILRNLITNAIKFTNNGGEIVVSARPTKNHNYHEISVTDNGVGIPEDKADSIFDNDEIYSTRGTENEKGTGLGLMLCKEFVEKHEGEIWVESEINKGTSFKFTLPSAI